ncbi:MAG: DUF5672 family protein [Casimicrobiaceae bacterium]
MLQLPDVTLCCVDARNHALALRALARCRRDIEFARTIFLTDAVPAQVDVPADIDVIPAGPIESHDAYSRIVLKELYPHVATSHVLVVQWDGYVVHPEAWTDEFLGCDYLGAPWPDGQGGYSVGNGGFSLRSRKLLEALQDDRFSARTEAEDVTICGVHRARLESDFGIRFGDVDLARRFSFEMRAIAGVTTFGFHGVFNLCHVESQHEIAELAATLPASIAGSQMTTLLLRNLVILRQFEAALALGQRMLEVDPGNEEAADAVVRSRFELAEERTKAMRPETSSLASRIAQRLRSFR